MPDVFVSYSRKDREFAERLVRALKAEGFDVWIDFEDIPFAVDWWEEIRQGIEAADNAIFVLSPHSVTSEICGLEMSHIRQNNKRLVPIVCHEIEANTIINELSHLNWIFFTDSTRFEQSFAALCETLRKDQIQNRVHTRLLLRANDWERQRFNPDLLLRGPDLEEMITLQTRQDLTPLQQDYLRVSEAHTMRNRRIARFAWGFLGGIGVGFYAFASYRSEALFQPQRVMATIALAQTFGLLFGAMAVLSDHNPLPLLRRFSQPLQAGIKIVLCFALGVLFWSTFHGFYLNYSEDLFSTTYLLGGFGIAFGFIVQILFRLPALLTIILTTISIWIPIYVLHEAFWSGTANAALLYFDDYNHVFTTGIVFALLIAVGTNAPALYRHLQALWQRFSARAPHLQGAE